MTEITILPFFRKLKFSRVLHDMHKHFKKFETIEESKRHTHESVSNKEDWDYLCDLFASEKYKVKFVIDNYSLMFLAKYFATYIYIIFFNIESYFSIVQLSIQQIDQRCLSTIEEGLVHFSNMVYKW